MTHRRNRWYRWIALGALLSAPAAFAGDPEKSPAPEPSPEARRQMAAAHEKMAECLRSDRPLAECRAEMMKSCHEMMGERGCPMMGGTSGGMGPGMMGGGMMKGEPAPEQPKP